MLEDTNSLDGAHLALVYCENAVNHFRDSPSIAVMKAVDYLIENFWDGSKSLLIMCQVKDNWNWRISKITKTIEGQRIQLGDKEM